MSLKHSPSKQVRRLRRAAASVYLKEIWGLEYSPRTLAKLACIGGPPMEYAGRFPLYTDGNLDTWASEKISPPVASTSQRHEQLVAA